MAGPWEKYGAASQQQPAAAAGPWSKYSQPAQAKAQPPLAGDPGVFKSGPAVQRGNDMTMTEQATDLAKSVGSGIGRAAVGLAGLPGDAQQIIEWLVMSPEGRQVMEENRWRVNKPATSSDILEGVNAATRPAPSVSQLVTGEKPKAPLEYEPKTLAGEYGQTVGEFAAGALGPGGALRKTAQVLVPGMASEAAGQATKGSELEPWVRAVFGLAGGVATAGRSPNITKLAAKGAPERLAVKAEADALYDKLRSAGIKYDSNSYDLMARNLAMKMHKEGFRPKTSAKVADSVEYVLEGMGKSPDYSDFEALRRNAGELLASADKTERKFGSMIVEALDDFATRSPLITSGNVPANQVAPLMKEARSLAQKNIKARNVEDAIERARNTASGFENGLRIEFRKILNNPKARAGYTPTELAVFREIVRGTSLQNLAAQFGRLGIGVGTKTAKAAALPLIAGGGGAAAIDPIVGGATVAAASGVKYLAGRNAEKVASRALGTVLSGKDAQRAALQAKRGEQLKIQLRRLLALDNATTGARLSPQPVPQQNGGNR